MGDSQPVPTWQNTRLKLAYSPETNTNGMLVCVAEGGWNLFGKCDFALVAGEGFEPSTFGL
jgi:hypothetical protein